MTEFRIESRIEFQLFAYGSMSEGMVHYQKISDFVVRSTPAQARGKAFRLKVGFPIVTDEAEDLIPGQLLQLHANPLLLALLDEFHGVRPSEPEKSLFFRKEIKVQTETGESVPAWIYFANPRKVSSSAIPIAGGDWPTSLKVEPVLTETLTERQKQYIQRLGGSVGREIVPIDLDLYRELMNLEMIVDKGRRLALSKLGHEVYRYLP